MYSIGRVLGDRNVLYKYVNPNLLAVMTTGLSKMEGDQPLVYLYLIDTVAGQVVHSVVHRRAGEPTSLVVSENWVLVSTETLFAHTSTKKCDFHESPLVRAFSTRCTISAPCGPSSR